MFDLTNKKMLKEWQKIECADIFSTLEEFAKFYYENGEKNCFRILTNDPWSKDNFFFGTYQELRDYYNTEYPKRNIGKKYYSLTVLDVFKGNDNGKERWYARCICDCGKESIKLLDSLKSGNARTCGCKEGKGISNSSRKKNIQSLINSQYYPFWDCKKNIVNPEEIAENSTEEFWWKDSKGNSFKLAPYVFYKTETSTSFPEQSIYYYLKEAFSFTINRAQYITKKGEIVEIDVYIPSLKIGIEYDGLYWHQNRVSSDIEKNISLNEENIFIIRVREEGLPKLPNFNGKTITRQSPLNKNESLVKVINSIFSTIKNVCALEECFKRVSVEYFEKNINSIYSLQFSNHIDNDISSSNLYKFWDAEKNNPIKPSCFPCDNNTIQLWFKCEKGFRIFTTSQKIFTKNTELSQIACPLSAFCNEYNKNGCKCEDFIHDLILRCAVSERQFNTQKGYPLVYYVEDDYFLSLIRNKESFIYNSGIDYEKLLRFFCLCSVDYNNSSFLPREVFELVYQEIINHPKINACTFFESIRHLLKTSELYLMLENSNICKLLLDSFDLNYILTHILKIYKNSQTNSIYIAYNFALISKHLCEEDLLQICDKLKTVISSFEWEFFISRIRNSVDEYIEKGILDVQTKNKIKYVLGDIFISAKTEQEKIEYQLQQNVECALQSQINVKEQLRETIRLTLCPRKEQYIYDLYKKGYLYKIGDEYRLDGKIMNFPTLNFSFIKNTKELLDIMEIIGLVSVDYNILDFDKDGLRERFISLARRSYDSDSAKYIYAGGLSERRLEKEIDNHLGELSEKFIESLINLLEYVSSHNGRPSSGYTRVIDADYVLYKLKKQLFTLKPSMKTTLKEPLYKRITSTPVVTFVAFEITMAKNERDDYIADEKSEKVESVKTTTNMVEEPQKITKVSHNSYPKQSSKSKSQNNKMEREKIFVSIAVVVIFILLIIFLGRSCSRNNNNTDLTNHKSIVFSLNNDDTYTMGRNLMKKTPDVIVIPEMYNDKPITIMDGNFSEYNITEVVGSKNLIKISDQVFGDMSDISHMKIEKVVFPKDGNLEWIGAQAFFNNDKLKIVILPQNFMHFEVGVFYSCDELSTLVIYSEVPPTGAEHLFEDRWNEGFYNRPDVPFTVYVPDSALETYRQSAWNCYNLQPISEFQ